jgi:lysozyme family protein
VKSEFNGAFEILIGHEGGYVDHPDDPGGETKYGISKRSYPEVNIAALTLDKAKAIYREDYWDRRS